jgi:hypothetical protein
MTSGALYEDLTTFHCCKTHEIGQKSIVDSDTVDSRHCLRTVDTFHTPPQQYEGED